MPWGPSAPIEYQIAVRGRGVGRLTKIAASELVTRVIDGDAPPRGIHVEIQIWSKGRSLTHYYEDENDGFGRRLRTTLRKLVQAGQVPLRRRR